MKDYNVKKKARKKRNKETWLFNAVLVPGSGILPQQPILAAVGVHTLLSFGLYLYHIYAVMISERRQRRLL